MYENYWGIDPKRVVIVILWLIGLIVFEFCTVPFFQGYYDAGWKVGIAITVGTLAYVYISMFGMGGCYLILIGLLNDEYKKELISGGLCLLATATVLGMAMYLHFNKSSLGTFIVVVAIVIAVASGINVLRSIEN